MNVLYVTVYLWTQKMTHAHIRFYFCLITAFLLVTIQSVYPLTQFWVLKSSYSEVLGSSNSSTYNM